MHLYVLTGNSVGEEAITSDELVLGRLPECGLTLPDQGVSRKHARVLVENGEPWLEDLGSANGTKIHGQRVQRARLEDGTVFSVGPIELRVRLEQVAAPQAAPPVASPSAGEPPRVQAREAVPEIQVRPQPSSGAAAAGTPVAAKSSAAASDPHRSSSGVLRYSQPQHRGLHAEDLSQRGPIQRLLLYLVALAVAAFLFYLAYQVTN